MAILLFLLGIVYIKNGLFFINPTLNIFRSFIYEVEFTDGIQNRSLILICKEKIEQEDYLKIKISQFDFSFAQKEESIKKEGLNLKS